MLPWKYAIELIKTYRLPQLLIQCSQNFLVSLIVFIRNKRGVNQTDKHEVLSGILSRVGGMFSFYHSMLLLYASVSLRFIANVL